MFSYLIRRALGPGVGGFWVGLVMVVLGIALTISSGVISEALGFPVTVVFYGLIVVGLIRMVAGVPALLGGGQASRRARAQREYASSGPAMPSYFAPPFAVTAGYCWQCGGRVKRGATICLNCGATQSAEKEPSPPKGDSYMPTDDPGVPPPLAHLPATNGPRRANPGYSSNAAYRPGRPYGSDESYRPGREYGADSGYGGYEPNGDAGGYGGDSGYGSGPGRAAWGSRDRRGDSRRGSRS